MEQYNKSIDEIEILQVVKTLDSAWTHSAALPEEWRRGFDEGYCLALDHVISELLEYFLKRRGLTEYVGRTSYQTITPGRERKVIQDKGTKQTP